MRKKLFLILLVVFSLSAVSNAQEVWSLERCVTYALDNNINIQQAKLGKEFAQLDVNQAKHAKYPSINGGSSVNWNFGRTVDPVTNDFNTETFFANNISISTGVILYNGGRIKNSYKQSQINNEAASFDMQQSERDIALLVANAYLSALFAEENYKITENQLALSQEQLGQLEKLIKAGTRPANEALNIEAQIALNEQNILSAENNIATAYLNLKQLMQIEKDIKVVVPEEEVKVNSDPEILRIDEVYASALRTQPNIKSADLNLESANLGVKIAESALLPSISAGGSLGSNYSNKGIRIDGVTEVIVDQEIFLNNIPQTIGFPQEVPIISNNPYFSQMTDNVSYGVGVNLNIPIYNNMVNRTNIERAKLNIKTTELSNTQLKNNLKTQVQQALTDARIAKKQYSASQKSMNALKAAFDNTKRKYDLGAVNTYDYIDAKNQLDVAQLNLIIAKYDYIFKTKVIDFYMGYPLQLN